MGCRGDLGRLGLLLGLLVLGILIFHSLFEGISMSLSITLSPPLQVRRLEKQLEVKSVLY